MILQEAVKSGKLFRAIGTNTWLTINKGTNEVITANSNLPVKLTATNILLDYEIKEEWYEGDFKSKWPNGVLCNVWNDNITNNLIDIIVNYDRSYTFPYIGHNNSYFFAEPLKPEEAPAIIES